jgi:pseudouridine kinase
MPRVVVIGGANVDIKGRAADRHQRATSNPGTVSVSPGGVGRNIAETLARLGVDASLITALGRDGNGALLREACIAAGVDMSATVEGDAPTGCYLAVLDEQGEMVSAVSDMRAMDGLTPANLEAAASQLDDAAMLVADCNLSIACLDWLWRFAGGRGKKLLIEPVSVTKAQKLLGSERAWPVFAITPNATQLAALTGDDGAAGLRQLHALGFQNIVMHRGRDGALASDGAAITPVPAAAVAGVVDVTGAGDAAVAGLVFGLLEGFPLAKAAALGQYAAAIKLGSARSVAEELNRDRLLSLARIT